MTRKSKKVTNEPNANCMPTSVQIQTKSRDIIDFNIPDGEDIAEMRINGQEIHQIHRLVCAAEREKKYWISLGVFLGLSCIVCIIMASWICNRMLQLPADTAAIQNMLDASMPPKFSPGMTVMVNKNKMQGVILKSARGEKGWTYKIQGQDQYYMEKGLTYISTS